MRLAVLINHGGMAARREWALKLLLALFDHFAEVVAEEALALSSTLILLENNGIKFAGLEIYWLTKWSFEDSYLK